MLIIDDKILIIHMKKCGGTSFCNGLIKALPKNRIYALGYTKEFEALSAEKRRRGECWKHSTTKEALAEFDPDNTGKFHVVLLSARPFWERVGSFYFYSIRRNEKFPDTYQWIKDLSFSEFMRSDYAPLETMEDYITDTAGNVAVHQIIPFDKIDETYSDFCEGLGLGRLQLPQLNMNPDPPDYRALYSDEDWNFINQHFATEDALLKSFQNQTPFPLSHQAPRFLSRLTKWFRRS